MFGSTKTDYVLQAIRYQDDQHTGREHMFDVLLRGIRQGTVVVKKDGSPKWNATFVLSSSDVSDRLAIQVKRKRRVSWWRDAPIGEVDVSLSDLLKKFAGVEAPLRLVHAEKDQSGIIYVSLRCLDGKTVAQISCNLEKMHQNINRIEQSVEQGEASVTTLGNIVNVLDEVVKAIDGVAKLNPCLNLSWQILVAMYKVVSKQIKEDQTLLKLVKLMKQTFEFAHDADSLPDETQRIRGQFVAALKLTLECCRFVEEYASAVFARRAVNPTSGPKINDYIGQFNELKKQLDSAIALHVASLVGNIDMRGQLEELKSLLKPIEMDATILSTLSRCLRGTRTKYLETIKSWAESETAQNILWLNGIAGAGKSTIAATVMDDWNDVRSLAACIFFQRGNEQHNSVVRTIAYQVAAFSPVIAKKVLKAVKENPKIPDYTLERQFKELLLDPLSQSSYAVERPILIILDALDECGSESQRREVLKLLKSDFSKLPVKFRIFVTSRPENDIMESLLSAGHIQQARINLDESDSQGDVHAYIDHELRNMAKFVPDGWSVEGLTVILDEAANGLFIWASTAMKMIRDSDDRQEELSILVSGIRSRAVGEYGIDALYETVLNASGIRWEKETSKKRFVKVLGFLLFAKEALSDEAIDGFLNLEPGKAKLTLERLRSVLSYEPGNPVRLHHASFGDYLTSPERSGNQPWHIDEASTKRVIAERCFDVMEKGLRFNICGLESLFVLNEDVPDLEEHVERNIPRYLEYACRFWAQHLRDLSTSIGNDLLAKLKSFAYERLLYSFEVLSLTNYFDDAEGALADASNWIKRTDEDVASFLQDASNLAYTSDYAISESTPHLYLSTLSLSKFDNRVAKHYAKMHPTVSVSVREAEGSGPRRETPGQQLYPVRSVSFSPDGRRVACASGRTVSVWVVDSGEFVAELTGHEGWVTSVAFFPDGKRVVSGSWDGTMRIWGIDTGKHVVFSSDLGDIWSVAVSAVAVSADGKLVASTENKVYIWNVDSGDLIRSFDTDNSQWRSPVAISPNGRLVASRYKDTEVRIWNVDSGKFVADPFEGHKDWVTSLVFSPDGSLVVSASYDRTLRIWDAFNGNVVAGPFVGHTGSVYSVVFSPDGKYVASGSDDESIRIWDARTAQVIAGPFYGHADLVTSIAWSNDGTRIATGSLDRTVRIWDAKKLLATQDVTVNCTEDTMAPRTPASNSALIETSRGETSSCKLDTIVNWTLDEDGWVLGERGELLLWLPDEIPRTLWLPQKTIAVIGPRYETRLDFTNYSDVLRKAWQRLPGHQADHNECSTVSSRLLTDPANGAHQENVAMVSITARSMPVKLFDKRDAWGLRSSLSVSI